MIGPSDMEKIRQAEVMLSGAVLFHDSPEFLARELQDMISARDGLRNVIASNRSNVAPGKQSERIEFMRATLKAVSPHYPGFLPGEIAKGIDEVCDLALKADELRDALDRAHLVFGAESDARKRDFEAAWLEGAREMYLDVQKAFPLTAPAGAYAEQLLAGIRKPLT